MNLSGILLSDKLAATIDDDTTDINITCVEDLAFGSEMVKSVRLSDYFHPTIRSKSASLVPLG